MIKVMESSFKLTKGVALTLAVLFAFFSAVTWVAARSAILIIAPAVTYTMAGCAIIAMAWATVAFAVERSAWLRMRWAEHNRDRTLADNEAERAEIQTDRERDLLGYEKQMMEAAIEQIQAGLIHPATLGEGKFSSFPAAVVKQVEAAASPLIEAPKERTFDFEQLFRKGLKSRDCVRVAVYGEMGSGKSDLIKHAHNIALDSLSSKDRIIIIDPHAPLSVYDDSVTVIGAGLDYESIATFLLGLEKEIKQRYKNGCAIQETAIPKMFIIAEEWTGIMAELQERKLWKPTYPKMLFMDSRKAAVGFIFVVHEYTVKSFGIERAGNLLNGIQYFVTLEKDEFTEKHSATVGLKFKKEQYPLMTPGKYRGKRYYTDIEIRAEKKKARKYLALPAPGQSSVKTTDEKMAIPVANWPQREPDEFEKSVLEALDLVHKMDAPSWNKLHHLVVGAAKNYSTNQKDRYKEVFEKFGIDPNL